jgi:hypothetical protein
MYQLKIARFVATWDRTPRAGKPGTGLSRAFGTLSGNEINDGIVDWACFKNPWLVTKTPSTGHYRTTCDRNAYSHVNWRNYEEK